MRVKAFFVIAVALFWSVSVLSQPVGVNNFATGNDLYRLCSDQYDPAQMFCQGYVEGGAYAIDVVNSAKAHGIYTLACLPESGKVSVGQVRDIVVQWLTAHPERRHQPAAAEALWALATAFPCKQ